MQYHIIALLLGVILDLIIGDPYKLPHPIRLIGGLIGKLDHLFMDKRIDKERNKNTERLLGLILVLIVICLTALVTSIVLIGAYLINPILGMVIEAILSFYILAAKSLKVESMKVYYALKNKSINEARYAVSMIVGRDTDSLDKEGIIRAAVETVAENTSDGVIAPLIYLSFGGPIVGLVYKAINTMDSMIGYHNERFENFGMTAAKLDDIVNYIPSRISAWLMILASFIGGKDYDGKNALKIFKRDRYNHKSPNSAQTESVCAGALGVRLAGDASYFGQIVKKPYIGDANRNIRVSDIERANRLMLITEGLCLLIAVIILVSIFIFL
ncbi:MAG: adenosylcobinamide-phosphate synthase CbiB [Lachnospiraceae bacterium]|nr:adenosylcobinamide-phosphate synthase CbiB [Lachnospiraceae bacterium]